MAQNETAADRSTAPPEARPVSAPIPGAAAAGAGGSAAAAGADPAGSLTTPAVAVSKPSPSYPALAKQQRVAGTVVVIGQVDEKGRVAKATAVSGPTLLRSAAEAAMLRWRFKPATRDGISIQSEVTVRFEFRY